MGNLRWAPPEEPPSWKPHVLDASQFGPDCYQIPDEVSNPFANHDTMSEDCLAQAFLAARVLAYAQGLSLLAAASEEFGWDLDLARVAEIWRAGCIIRSALLDDISSAVRLGLPHGALHLSPAFSRHLTDGTGSLRELVAQAALAGQPVPGFSAALAYLETMRKGRGTTDLIQAQRDFFGAHGFERVDATGAHHGPWHK